ncbi:Potassium transporter [Podospora pseudocomata]|uniref:Potassium transporter n=1 Tax=Podospora pseudocomata TaxID=2093779 RepID=A0ABR0GGS4_9PEZI|nr:Potassium transporter [Podospora pseudocomata]
MGFLSHKRRDVVIQPTEKWDFISLNDFKSTSCWTPFAYGILIASMFLSLSVYAVDGFTAYQLIAFDRWSSQIEPAQFIPFQVTKWVFAGCIILSVANLCYEHLRANRIMRRGSVAECFLDHIAQRMECLRPTSGWRRFLVFAELTKSKKGVDYVALFTFFSFQSWIRVLLCSGPRQVLNALTLYSIFRAKLNIKGDNFDASLADFIDKIQALATEDTRQSVILCGMIFTVVVWIFSFLSLVISGVLFVLFLWSYIPREDGGLTGFCERKVNKRLKQIVSVKINKAMEEDERQRKKAELRAAKKNGENRPVTMKPSLPVFADDNLAEMPSLKRAETFMSISEKTDRSNTPGSFEMNTLGQKRPVPSRSGTTATSVSKYSARASLLGGAAAMGVSRSDSPGPAMPAGFPPPPRTATAQSNRSYASSQQLNRMPSNGSNLNAGYTAGQAMYSQDAMPSMPPPVRPPMNEMSNYRGPGPNQQQNRWPGPNQGRPGYDDYSKGRASPAPSTMSYRNGPTSPPRMGPGGYPMRSATGPMPPRGQQPPFPPQRNMTAPIQPFHQRADSNGSGVSMGMGGPPRQPYHHQSASNSSLRNMTMPGAYQPQEIDEYRQPPLPNLAGFGGPLQPQQNEDYRQPTLPNIEAPQQDNDYRQPTLPNLDGVAPNSSQSHDEYQYTSRSLTGSNKTPASYPAEDDAMKYEDPSNPGRSDSPGPFQALPAEGSGYLDRSNTGRSNSPGPFQAQPMGGSGQLDRSNTGTSNNSFQAYQPRATDGSNENPSRSATMWSDSPGPFPEQSTSQSQSMDQPATVSHAITTEWTSPVPIQPSATGQSSYVSRLDPGPSSGYVSRLEPDRSPSPELDIFAAPARANTVSGAFSLDDYDYDRGPQRANTTVGNMSGSSSRDLAPHNNNNGWSDDLERGNQSRY